MYTCQFCKQETTEVIDLIGARMSLLNDMPLSEHLYWCSCCGALHYIDDYNTMSFLCLLPTERECPTSPPIAFITPSR
jgi:hypothetical protein